MKNLIKNVVRSFTKNKISIIGLIFLLFFGLGVFCTMNNTTTNIRNEYTSLAQEGRLHDFTAAELYDVGTAEFVESDYGISYKGTAAPTFTAINDLSTVSAPVSQYYYGTTLGDVPDRTYYVPLPRQQIIEQEGTYYTYRTYSITLDKNLSTGLYRDYASSHEGTGLVQFTYNTPIEEYTTRDNIPYNQRYLYEIE
ncbi:MAG: hypothetical protein MJ233_00095 [Mycoplasmoidaceae bacterium]|nr:hypothetical protein [Mycoplasmoidaceae bacterium]